MDGTGAAASSSSADAPAAQQQAPLAALLGLAGREAASRAVPPAVTRRVLELVTYLAKHQPKAARDLLAMHIRRPAELLDALSAKKARACTWPAQGLGPGAPQSPLLLPTHAVPPLVCQRAYGIACPTWRC